MTGLDALEPTVGEPLGELIDGVWDGRLDVLLVERCRQRLCELLGADTDIARHRSAPDLDDAPDPDTRDVACLAFAEQWMLDPHAVTDEQAAEVTAVLTAPECASFTITLAVLEAQIRSHLTLDALGSDPRP